MIKYFASTAAALVALSSITPRCSAAESDPPPGGDPLEFRGTISGMVWHDRNRNGIHQRKESAIQGIDVHLVACDGTFIASSTTVAGGLYRFDDLPMGNYCIACPAMFGLALTRVHIGNPDRDSDVFPGLGMSECLQISPAILALDVDLGLRESYGCSTFNPTDWGVPANTTHLSTLLVDNFPTIYRRGLKLGLSNSRHQLQFSSAQAVINFLPASGPLGVLAGDQVDPITTPAGEFAGNLLALKLNVDFSLRRKTVKGLAGLRIERGNKFENMRVIRILAMGQRVLAGRTDQLPAGYTLADLNETIQLINHNFDCGVTDFGFLRK
jgi:hypothetical protein